MTNVLTGTGHHGVTRAMVIFHAYERPLSQMHHAGAPRRASFCRSSCACFLIRASLPLLKAFGLPCSAQCTGRRPSARLSVTRPFDSTDHLLQAIPSTIAEAQSRQLKRMKGEENRATKKAPYAPRLMRSSPAHRPQQHRWNRSILVAIRNCGVLGHVLQVS